MVFFFFFFFFLAKSNGDEIEEDKWSKCFVFKIEVICDTIPDPTRFQLLERTFGEHKLG